MQQIASEMNLSETVYVIDRNNVGFSEGKPTGFIKIKMILYVKACPSWLAFLCCASQLSIIRLERTGVCCYDSQLIFSEVLLSS